MATSSQTVPANLWPSIKVERIQNPNRFYAFPIIGGLIKFFMLIPVAVDLLVIGIGVFVMQIINSFVVLFTGKYWKPCYDLTIGFMRFMLKISFFWRGLTNTYPGFDMQIHDAFSLNMEMPTQPNRLFAIPILGGLIRSIAMIPFAIYAFVIYSSSGQSAASLATIIGSFFVLFTGNYPETAFELNRDGARLSQASSAYMSGLTDSYPSFWISMNHKTLKIILIIAAIIFTLFSNISRANQRNYQRNLNQNYYQNNYQNSAPANQNYTY